MSIERFVSLDEIPDMVFQHLASRDAALWVGALSQSDLNASRGLIELPWQLVLCEDTSSKLAQALEASAPSDRLVRRRGFVHIVASDPVNLELPPQSLPVYFLNGRDDASSSDEATGSSRSSQRRRLNSIHRLEESQARLLVVASTGDKEPLDEIFELWNEGFRTDLVVLSTSASDSDRVELWAQGLSGRSRIFFVLLRPEQLSEFIHRAAASIPDERTVIRFRTSDKDLLDVDVTDCELADYPILDRYEAIRTRDLHRLMPEDLSKEEFSAFFSGSAIDWRPYAAGVPWIKDQRSLSRVLKALAKCARGLDHTAIFLVASEAGAGGTTTCRALALEAARAGYPVLVAKNLKFTPKVTELTSYFHRVRQMLGEEASNNSSDSGAKKDATPWLLVFDIQHWEGRRAEILDFIRALGRGGQPTVVLTVTGPDLDDQLVNARETYVLDTLKHQLTEIEVRGLGAHLNTFLKHYGDEKSEQSWLAFWEKHRPDGLSSRVTSFWIALEFWLKGQIDLSVSIQEWVAKQFKCAALEPNLNLIILEIAALSVERQPYPELLLPPPPEGSYPYSSLLEDVRSELPALALLCEGRSPGRQWAMAHDLIGRYLLSAVYFDPVLLKATGLTAAQDPVHLRLLLLRKAATSPELSKRYLLPFAVDFAVNTLKLGTDGNPEFYRYWQEALGILESIPKIVWETSRTFNHHVAISRRRVATSDNYFNLTADQKSEQLKKAIEHLEYALKKLKKTDEDDESDMNLLNSLSLAYQNLADLEESQGAESTRLAFLRIEATKAARKAQEFNPTNSYVLETVARNLLQNGRIDGSLAAECAAEALGYIYQAILQDHSLVRELRLTKLAKDALQMLRSADASKQLDSICQKGNPLGFLGRAWLILNPDVESDVIRSLDSIPVERVEAAIRELGKSRISNNFLIVKFRYDLVSISKPMDFQEQLNLLDELAGFGSKFSLQLEVEHAILLHQMNRHPAANLAFGRIRQRFASEDSFVDVPERLRWLRDPSGQKRKCHGRVFEIRSYRSTAKIKDLAEAVVPFIPQEFGQERIPPGTSLNCTITFGPRGPFVKPILSDMES